MHQGQALNQRSSTGRARLRDILAALALFLFLSLGLFVVVALALPAGASHDSTAPSIGTVTPMEGSSGTYVTIEGEGLSEGIRVYFGGNAVPHEVVEEGKIGFEAPDYAPSEYVIQVYAQEGSDRACCFNLTRSDPQNPESGSGSATAFAQPESDDACRELEKNKQCNDFGTIAMPAQTRVAGKPEKVTATIHLDRNYADQETRTLMFSVRTQDASHPVQLQLVTFSTPRGDIYTTNIEHEDPNQLSLWVDVLDVPVGAPINLTVEAGATDRGAFQLETLIMPFDRGYEPIKDSSGKDVSLYSFTLLGVNKETGAFDDEGGALSKIRGAPAAGVPLVIGTLLGLAAVLSRRGSA